MNFKIIVLTVVSLLFVGGVVGCTSAPHEDNFTSGYVATRHRVHNLKEVSVKIDTGQALITLAPGAAQFLGIRSGEYITVTWMEDGKYKGRNMRVPKNGGLLIK